MDHTSALFAQDFKEALSDLRTNDKYKIHNLTMIANDNTNHAEAIARALEEHIKTAPVSRKLWALYLLDSIVKNVGSPYTNLLGRNLFSTFMSAYQRVGDDVRRSMEAMLKTWREPVPGAMSSTPVFPDYVTRHIDNALLKARTAFVQQQQEQARAQRQTHGLPPRPPTVDQFWNNTSTPPINGPLVNGAGYRPPPSPAYQNGGFPQQSDYPPQHAYPSPAQPPPPLPYGPPAWAQYHHSTPPPYQHFERPPVNQVDEQARLSREVENLISSANGQLAMRSWDKGIQDRHRNLLALQRILNSSQLSPDQLRAIQDQIAPSNPRTHDQGAPSVPPPAPPVAQITNGFPHALPRSPPQAPPQHAAQTSAPPPAPLSLGDILAATKSANRTPMSHGPPQLPPISQPNLSLPSSSSNPSSGGLDVIAQLRAAGLLPPATPEARATSAANGMNGSVYPPPPLPKSGDAVPSLGPTKPKNDVELNTASIKIPRPHLISSLYTSRPSQCSTCGRRFATTPDGRARKARHLDYHFRTNRRLAESSRQAVSRSWYLDEIEWIRFREIDDADDSADPASARSPKDNGTAGTGGEAGSGEKGKPKMAYVKAPVDAAAANTACPICQERFETSWLDEEQEFVWIDAVEVGGRVFHKSCRDEVTRNSATPAPNNIYGRGGHGVAASIEEKLKGNGVLKGISPVLGKRKMGDDEEEERNEDGPEAKRRVSDAVAIGIEGVKWEG